MKDRQELAAEAASLEEVAASLGRPPEWLRRNWQRLARHHGFPRRHPSGWTWPRRAVAAWLACGGIEREHPANDNAGEAGLLAALDAAYGEARP